MFAGIAYLALLGLLFIVTTVKAWRLQIGLVCALVVVLVVLVLRAGSRSEL